MTSVTRTLPWRAFLIVVGILTLTSLWPGAAFSEEDPSKGLYSVLADQRGEKEPVVVVELGEVGAVQAYLKQKGIEPDIVKRENNPVYYVTKFVHRLRRYGKLWILFDRREQALSDVLRDRFLDDYRVEVDRDFDHLTLIAVVNEFATDASPNNRIALEPIARVNHVVTDLTLLPQGKSMLVITKRGDVHLIDLTPGSEIEPRVILKLDEVLEGKGLVHQVGEAGLIGMALHPAFPNEPKLYLHYNFDSADGERVARISEWVLRIDGNDPGRMGIGDERVLLDIQQPASNHNGGALAFGEDGFLYIAVGDGEAGEWVKGRAKALSLRGKVLRIDVDNSEQGRAYAIPQDNPFVGDPAFPPETWAWGFRNPWRIAFAPDGRLIAGDVGEDVHEEITIVRRGRHHGWPAMEGDWCRLDDVCDPATSIGPLFQYGRDAGMSVTGGEVYEGERLPWLNGAYIFADFSSGWIWSIDLGDDERLSPPDEVTELGRWTVEFTAFTKAADGEIYVGDLRGRIYRLAPLPAGERQTGVGKAEKSQDSG